MVLLNLYFHKLNIKINFNSIQNTGFFLDSVTLINRGQLGEA